MDRGVKVAIFVASILSLALGLIWDQVLSHARTTVEESQQDELGPQRMSASIGSPDLPRMQPPESITPAEPVEDAPQPETPTAPTAPTQSTHTVQAGDSWWKLAHVTYKDRALSTKEIQDANPDVKTLKVGIALVIPAGKATLPVVQGRETQPREVPPTPQAPENAAATEYEVQAGDSWWKIAYVHFKSRKLETSDLEKANPGVTLKPGIRVKIPAGK